MDNQYSDDEEYEAILTWNCGMFLKRKIRAQKCQIFQRWHNLIQNPLSNIKIEDPYITDYVSKSQNEYINNNIFSSNSSANHQLQQELQRLRNQEVQLRQETKKAKETLDNPQYQSSFSVRSSSIRPTYYSKL